MPQVFARPSADVPPQALPSEWFVGWRFFCAASTRWTSALPGSGGRSQKRL